MQRRAIGCQRLVLAFDDQAVSVMAEVLAVKNGVVLPRDMEVAQAKNERAVLANELGDLVCGVARSS